MAQRKSTKRRGPGRPPIAPEDRRSNRVVVFLADDEFARLQELAEECGMYVGATAYELLSRALQEAG